MQQTATFSVMDVGFLIHPTHSTIHLHVPSYSVSLTAREMAGRTRSTSVTGGNLRAAGWQVPGIKYNRTRVGSISTVTFLDFGVKVKYDLNPFLVDLIATENGTLLILDSVAEKANLWRQNEVLLFNTYQWWYYRGTKQPWQFVKVGDKILKDIDRNIALKRALGTWGQWVDSDMDPAKTRLFFQLVSPSHYDGRDWNQPEARNCADQTEPVLGSVYPGRLPPALGLQKEALSLIKKPVTLLDITHLSQFRKDGHPSIYGQDGRSGMDCLHWCVGGVPDIWNEILYNLLFIP
ncbi:protein trichome birefringence-like 41 [Coffea eugenioides]|uniref:protein trichome birefringence-like 41 n=1 Tax=Coffea eugenioides TaxID=49369 RepID=UPI000F612840|nr:protein trichome birefringence-like 41 [Coffea eugenioides]